MPFSYMSFPALPPETVLKIRTCSMASSMVMPKSTVFMMIWATAEMMRVAPAAPRVMKGRPEGSITSVGDMEDRGRFPGSGALTLSGLVEKSSISSLSMKPYSGTKTALPKK